MYGTNGRGDIKGRLCNLERKLNHEPDPVTPEDRARHLAACERNWRTELESIAIDLAVGHEPGLTFRDGAFYTLGERLAASRTVYDLQALGKTESQREAIPPERWGVFRAEDEDAERLVSELFEMAEDADVPKDYWTWLGAWPYTPEILAESYHAGCVPPASEGRLPYGEDLLEPEAWELSRRLAWVLIHEPEARAALEELCTTRDAFINQRSLGEGGS